MTDSHMRILRLISHERQRELRDYDAVDDNEDAISSEWRQNLERRLQGFYVGKSGIAVSLHTREVAGSSPAVPITKSLLIRISGRRALIAGVSFNSRNGTWH